MGFFDRVFKEVDSVVDEVVGDVAPTVEKVATEFIDVPLHEVDPAIMSILRADSAYAEVEGAADYAAEVAEATEILGEGVEAVGVAAVAPEIALGLGVVAIAGMVGYGVYSLVESLSSSDVGPVGRKDFPSGSSSGQLPVAPGAPPPYYDPYTTVPAVVGKTIYDPYLLTHRSPYNDLSQWLRNPPRSKARSRLLL